MRYQKINTRASVPLAMRTPQGAFRAQCAGCEEWKTCRNIQNAPLCVMCAAGRNA